jgi:MFS family permease
VYQVDIASLRSTARAASDRRAAVVVPRAILVLGFVSCMTDISSEMVASILPLYAIQYLQFSPLQFGFIDGLYQGVSAIARLASGVIGDRWQRHKLVALAGYGMSAACKLGMWLIPGSTASLAAMISIDRTGKGVRTAPRDAMISMHASESNLAAAFGVHRALDTAGVVIGPLTAFLVLRWLSGYETVFAISFGAALIGLAALALLIEDSPAARKTTAPSLRSMVEASSHPQFRTVLAVGGLLNATVMGDAFLYLVLQRHAAIDMTALPLFYVTTAVFFLAFAIPMGQLADRVGRARVFLGGHVLVAILYAAALALPLNAAGVIVCLALYGAYYAATDGVLAALITGLGSTEVVGSRLGAVGTATSLARLCGAIVCGAIWSWQGPMAALGFTLASTLVVLAGFGPRLLKLDDRT